MPGERLPPAIEAAAYYVTAEALDNVVKYAGASEATVRIVEDDEQGAVVVEVADDGIGGADPSLGSGLEGLVDRVETLDGTSRSRVRRAAARESAQRFRSSVRERDPASAESHR